VLNVGVSKGTVAGQICRASMAGGTGTHVYSVYSQSLLDSSTGDCETHCGRASANTAWHSTAWPAGLVQVCEKTAEHVPYRLAT
jgi:hypothetical protein